MDDGDIYMQRGKETEGTDDLVRSFCMMIVMTRKR